MLFERARAKRPLLLAKRFAVIKAGRLGARGRASDTVDRIHRATMLLLQGQTLESAALAVGYHDTGSNRHAIKAGDSLTKAVRRLGFRVAFNQRDIDASASKGGLVFPASRWPLALLPSEYGKVKPLAVRPSVPLDCVSVPLCVASFGGAGVTFHAVDCLMPLALQVQPMPSASKAARLSNGEQIRRAVWRKLTAVARHAARQARKASARQARQARQAAMLARQVASARQAEQTRRSKARAFKGQGVCQSVNWWHDWQAMREQARVSALRPFLADSQAVPRFVPLASVASVASKASARKASARKASKASIQAARLASAYSHGVGGWIDSKGNPVDAYSGKL